MEPITLFARIADPAGVARLLRRLHPNVQLDGSENNWQRATVAFDGKKGWLPFSRKQRLITFTHDPQYYAEPNWSVQMNGMRGYFSRFVDTERKERVLMLTTTFRFSLGVLFDPDPDPAGD